MNVTELDNRLAYINSYGSAEEAMVVRGLHLNILVDKLNEIIDCLNDDSLTRIDKVKVFSYQYSTGNDTGIMRGIHLNHMISKINEMITTESLPITSLDTRLIYRTDYRIADDVIPVRNFYLNLVLSKINEVCGSQSWESYWATRTPSELELTVDSDTQITLDWNINGTGYDGFSVERSDDSGVTYNEITTVTIVTATYVNSGLTRGLQYYYRIRAYKGTQYSPYSNIANAWTTITALIGDGHTVAHYIASDATTITKDGSNLVASWADKLGSGHDLLQATAAKKPVWSDFGVVFASNPMHTAGQSMKTVSFDFNQPIFIYAVAKIPKWASASYMIDGDANGSGTLLQYAATPGIEGYAGTLSAQNNDLGLSRFGIVRLRLDGANSKLVVDKGVATTGNFGAANMDGITIGARGDQAGYWSDSVFQELLFRDIDDSLTPADELALVNYLNNQHYVIPTYQQILKYMGFDFGAFLCWSMSTFYGVDAGYVDGDVNVFNPTDLDIDEWLDTFVTAGMNYATICAKTEDGFCLWPTTFADPAHVPYGIGSTAWYAANGNYDILKHYTDGLRSRGLGVVIYYSIRDLTHEARSGTDETTDAATYIAMIKLQLTELLTNYGAIDALWFDDWQWHISYANIPFLDIYNHIKNIQPNCLVITNEHLHPSRHGDIEVYEPAVVADGHVAAGNVRYSEEVETIRTDGVWSYSESKDQSAASLKSKAVLLAAIAQANGRNSNYLTGVSPDKSGHLTAAQKSILESLQT